MSQNSNQKPKDKRVKKSRKVNEKSGSGLKDQVAPVGASAAPAAQVAAAPKAARECKYGDKCLDLLKGGCRFTHSAAKAPAVAAAPAAASVETPLPVPTDLAGLYKLMCVGVPAAHPEVLEYAKGQGWNVNAYETAAIPHPLSHLCREIATLQAATASGGLSGIAHGRILSVYGAGRDHKLLGAEKAFHAPGKPIATTRVVEGVVTKTLSAEVVCGPQELYPGDSGRVNERTAISGKFNCVIAVDVYWDGARGRITPDTLKRWAGFSLSQSVMLVFRRFRGQAGADLVPGFGGENEGVWYKEREMINFSPDQSDYRYPGHYGYEFLDAKCVDGLSITHMGDVGPYTILKATIDADSVVRVPVHIVPRVELIDFVEIPKTGLAAWVLWQIGSTYRFKERFPGVFESLSHATTLRVHRGLLLKANALNVARAPTGHIYDGVVSAVAAAASEDATMVALSSRYPVEAQRLIRDTAVASLYVNRRETSEMLAVLRSDHYQSELQLLTARAPLPATPISRRWIHLCFFLVVAGLVATIFTAPFVRAADNEPSDGAAYVSYAIATMILFMLSVRVIAATGTAATHFEAWLHARTVEPGSERGSPLSGVEYLTEGCTIKPVVVKRLPEDCARGSATIKVDGREVTIREAELLLSEPTAGVACMYPLIITNGLLYQPLKCELNLLYACLGRLHLPVTGLLDDERVGERWQEAGEVIAPLLHSGYQEPHTRAECAAFLPGSKAAVFLATADDLEAGRLRPMRGHTYRKEVNVKTNETLAMKDIDGVLSIKPRAIVVLGNDYHVVHAPHARSIGKHMHELFDGSVHLVGGTPVRIWYASGLTGAALNEIGAAIAAGENVIAVSGDDSIGYNGALNDPSHVSFGAGCIFEGDLKACDQSQREACLRHTVRAFELLGMPASISAEFYEMCCAGYVARYKRVSIVGETGPELPTGADETTIGNSLAVLTMMLVSFIDAARSLTQIAHELGFTLKVAYGDVLQYRTFLKGWFQSDSAGNLAWFPLPSLLIKCGKLQSDPAKVGSTRTEGIGLSAYAVAQGLHTVPRDYPLLGPFIAAMERCGRKTRRVISAAEDGWYKPKVDSSGVNRSSAMVAVTHRYGISQQDVQRCEELFNSLTRLPAFVYDSTFERLAAVDYE